jgi:outer membrane protein
VRLKLRSAGCGLVLILLAPVALRAQPKGRPASGATYVSGHWRLPSFETPPEPAPTETLADALAAAYRTAPSLQVQRYELRATDEDYAQALSELRPTTRVEVTGDLSRTIPGRTTQASRSPAERLLSPNLHSNVLGGQVVVEQPLYTGGRGTAAIRVADAAVGAGRAQLRGAEGDLFLQVIEAYADIRRDSRALALRAASLKQIQATLEEVKARREAGELTLTDVAQADTQLGLALSQYNSTDQQLEQDRATFAALVGHDPGVLAPEPLLPQFPASVDAALDIADRLNPDLKQAIELERSSRARVAAAAAEGQPRLSVTGTAGVNGRASPFNLRNDDQPLAGHLVLTVPLTNGGRVGSLIAQARDRNSADRVRIEGVRRQMVQTIVTAWNGVAIAQRNIEVGAAQLEAARILNEGTFEEYRAGLRSTFDVLFAQERLRDAEIALVEARRDLYVGQALLLRHIGMLEARSLLTGTALYDPEVNLRHAKGRGALPWDPLVRTLDRLGRRVPDQQGIEQPAAPAARPVLVPGAAPPLADPVRTSPNVPIGGTTGAPVPAARLKRP